VVDPDQIILVPHRGAKIPIRAKEMIVWSKMSFASREEMVKSYREKLRSGMYVKLENGALVKKQNAV
jgi:hypothetical protein